jgi:uncharacterized protein
MDTPLSLEHRKILFEPLHAIGSEISEYSFANLYLFRREHDYRVVTGDELLIRGRMRDGMKYVMPVRNVRNISSGSLKNAIETDGMMFPIPEEWLAVFDPEQYAISSNDADSDYIHKIAKLATYAGNNLHGQRNLVNQFLRRYGSNAFPLTKERLVDARVILDAWQNEAGVLRDETDYEACKEAIALYDDLVLCGAIYYADSEPAGFIIGEELNNATFALHFAKARRKFSGVYQYMFSQLATVMPSRYTAFNFEQDLGIESLRRAKSSYHPEKMIRKFRISLR